MKKLYIFLLAAMCMSTAQAQNVGIGTAAPAGSAMLEVSSTSKGLLIPRMTTAQRSAIPTPDNGLMVYDVITNSFWFFKNTVWTEVVGGNFNLPYAGTANVSGAAAFDVTNVSNTAILGYAGGIGHGVAGYAAGTGNGVIGQGNTGAGIKGTSVSGRGGSFETTGSGAGVYGSSGNGVGGHFRTDGDKPGVYGVSENGIGGKFEGNNDSAGVYGLSLHGPGGEFKGADGLTGVAVKARGSIDILKNRLRFAGNMANNNAHGIEFSNNAGTTMSHFYGMLNDSVSGFFGGGNWRLLFNNINGNLGLQSNTNPRAPLSFASSAGNKIALYGDGGTEHYGIGIGNGTIQLYGPTTGADVVMGYGSSTAFTETMRVKGTGNVGIGTAAPNYKLDVNGTTSSNFFITPTGALLGTNLTVPGNATIVTNASIGGTIKIAGGSPTQGAVLTATDALGNASWNPSIPTPYGNTERFSFGYIGFTWVNYYNLGTAIPAVTSVGPGLGNQFQITIATAGLYYFDMNYVTTHYGNNLPMNERVEITVGPSLSYEYFDGGHQRNISTTRAQIHESFERYIPANTVIKFRPVSLSSGANESSVLRVTGHLIAP